MPSIQCECVNPHANHRKGIHCQCRLSKCGGLIEAELVNYVKCHLCNVLGCAERLFEFKCEAIQRIWYTSRRLSCQPVTFVSCTAPPLSKRLHVSSFLVWPQTERAGFSVPQTNRLSHQNCRENHTISEVSELNSKYLRVFKSKSDHIQVKCVKFA